MLNDSGSKKDFSSVGADVAAGGAIYSNALLAAYDFIVLTVSNPYAWQCPTPKLLKTYDDCVSSNHLDVGVGTGYYLDNCQFPSKKPKIFLGDLNPNCLRKVETRINRHAPESSVMNVFDIDTYPKRKFDSIGINYLLHCIPGPFARKAEVIANLASLLNPNGVIFGSTILGEGVQHNTFGKFLMKKYNQKGIFANHADSREELDQALSKCCKGHSVEVIGTVAIFKGYV